MADFGLRVAPTGGNVLADADSTMLLTTKASIPKSKLWEEHDMDVESNPLTVAHGMAEVPFVVAYGTSDASGKVMGFYANPQDTLNVDVFVSADTTNIRLEVIGAGLPNKKVYSYVFFPEI